MRTRTSSLIPAIVLASLLLGACNMPTPTPAFVPPANVPNVVQPALVDNNVVFIVGTPSVAPPDTARTIRVFVVTSQSERGEPSGPTGVSRVILSYAGSQIGVMELDPSKSYVQDTIQWTPPSAPGEYTVEADIGGPSIVNPRSQPSTTLCVDEAGLTIEGPHTTPGDHTCALLPDPDTSAALHIIHTNATARMGCTTSTLEFDITVDNPDLAYLAYVEVANLVDGFGWHTFHADRRGPAEFSSVTEWSTADLMGQLAGSNTITWRAGAMPIEAHVVTSGPHELVITPPSCLVFPTLPEPLIPRIPDFGPFRLPAQPLMAIQTETPGATATPSELTCPPGTYYAEGSKSCVKIYLSPVPAATKVPACKKYSDPSGCTSNGCNWDKGANTCS